MEVLNMAETAVKRGPGRPLKRNKKFREEDKIGGAKYSFKNKPRIKCKVYNQEFPGHDIVGCVNSIEGVFRIKHGAEVELTEGQIEALQHAVFETTKYQEIKPDEFEKQEVVILRFSVIPVNMFPKKVVEAPKQAAV
jgi:hypothetical protein